MFVDYLIVSGYYNGVFSMLDGYNILLKLFYTNTRNTIIDYNKEPMKIIFSPRKLVDS